MCVKKNDVRGQVPFASFFVYLDDENSLFWLLSIRLFGLRPSIMEKHTSFEFRLLVILLKISAPKGLPLGFRLLNKRIATP
jgi:hypothetical protein